VEARDSYGGTATPGRPPTISQSQGEAGMILFS
jgi:hypothetical protein